MSRHLSAANTVESKPWAGAGRAGSRSSVTATRVNERTDTGFRPPQGVWNGVTHISTERPNPARASRRRPGCGVRPFRAYVGDSVPQDRKSTRLNSSHGYISYAVFCLKKKKQ